MKQKLALFDFCETLTNFQTVDGLINLVKDKRNNRILKTLDSLVSVAVRLKFFSILYKVFPKNNFHKRLRLLQLKGLLNSELSLIAKEYYEETIKVNLLPKIIEKIDYYRKKGFKIIIVSGGYSIYIDLFAKDYSIDYVIATDIDVKNGFCTGKIKGIDCMHQQKITRIKQVLNLDNYDLENSVAFSDSITDLPLLKLVGNGYVVSNTNSQCWAKENELDEIIWYK